MRFVMILSFGHSELDMLYPARYPSLDHSFWKISCLSTCLVTQLVLPNMIQGYVIYSVRNKLKKQYAHLKGTQIKKLKLSGVQVCSHLPLGGKSLVSSYMPNSLYLLISYWWLQIFLLDYGHHIISRGCLHRRHNVGLHYRATKCRCSEGKNSYHRGMFYYAIEV